MWQKNKLTASVLKLGHFYFGLTPQHKKLAFLEGFVRINPHVLFLSNSP